MKRKALLIGCGGNSAISQGVRTDIKNYESFLKSHQGGGYYDSEIVISEDESRFRVIDRIRKIRAEQNGMVFVVFSGHGEYDNVKKQERVLELALGTQLYESDLINLAPRQIIILDSCAGLKSSPILNSLQETKVAACSSTMGLLLKYRAKYEQECLNCDPQQIHLYSSEVGEYSSDMGGNVGGLYTDSLLNALKQNTKARLDIVSAHNIAYQQVVQRSYNRQHPSVLAPRFHDEKLLPGAIYIEN